MKENLIYRTGEAPINAEATPQVLLDHDITPADYFYIRCHGEVPEIEWDSHIIEIQVQDNDFNFTISMDDLKANFKPVTMAVTMVCDGNRRKELNVFGGHSNGFDWGCCAVSTGKFEGVLLRELLTKSVPEDILQSSTHVIFESADELKKGHYGTSLPLSDVLQSSSDFLIAYGLNGERLPKQHGYPVRTILPGYVGGRSVKWLKKIILSQSESDNPYHIQDNSLFPPFVTSTALMSKYINDEKNAYEKGESPVRQRSILYELNINSTILSPANGSTLRIEKDLHKYFSFQGYAYDGGGRRIVRVEVTLDDGVTWLEAEITYPSDYEPPHGDRYYIMCKWKVDIPVWKVASSMRLSVRAWNQSFNTQPRNYTWNILGMMNNAWYTVHFRRKESIVEILHPVSMSPRDTKGWLEFAHGKSVHYEEKTVPPIRYTRKQVSQHNSVSDAWVIIDDKVYDLTDFLNMHPGGQASILAHAGQDVTTLFYDIHSEDTHVLKAAYIIGHLAEDGESTAPDGEGHAKHPFLSRKHPRKTPEGHEIELNPFKWTEITLTNKEQINHDTRRFTFALSSPDKRMWLPWGKHVNIGVELHDRMVVRPYTPVKPVKREEDNGTFELVVKIYFSTDERPGGEMTQILEKLSVGDKVLVKGPEGVLWYLGNGQFCIHGHFFYCNKMNFIVGGTGITPALTIMRAVILAEKLKNVSIRLVFSNKTPADILCQEELEEIVSVAKSASVKVCHVISRGDEENKDKLKEHDGFAYESGRVNQEILKKHVLSADDDSFCFLCGPPAMIAKAVLPALASLGFDDDQILEF